MKRVVALIVILVAISISGCAPALFLETSSATQPQPVAPTAVFTAANEALVPASWTTHTSQQCEYTISYPAEMQVTEQTPYSKLFAFKPSAGQEGTPNFVYASVITPAVQSMVADGAYQGEVYNYDPKVMVGLLKLNLGESKAFSEIADLQSWFTYQRVADATIDGYTALAFENVKPWEFPGGTKELRYYVSTGRCGYLVGGYVDTTGSNKPDVITEDLFHQIIITVRLTP